MSDTIKALVEAILNFECATGLKPRHLYLGSRPYHALDEHLKPLRMMERAEPYQVAGYPPRPTFDGCEVYRVDDVDHIGVS